MATVRLNTATILDWQSFHEESRQAFGFPDFYGMNVDAWIDCLTYLDEGDGMSAIHLAEGEVLNIEVSDSEVFRSRVPEVYNALVECCSFVNARRIEAGKLPVLALILM